MKPFRLHLERILLTLRKYFIGISSIEHERLLNIIHNSDI